MLCDLNALIVDSKLCSMSPVVQGKGKELNQRNYHPNKSVQQIPSSLKKSKENGGMARSSKSDLSNPNRESKSNLKK